MKSKKNGMKNSNPQQKLKNFSKILNNSKSDKTPYQEEKYFK
jgi:hypothetical protein